LGSIYPLLRPDESYPVVSESRVFHPALFLLKDIRNPVKVVALFLSTGRKKKEEDYEKSTLGVMAAVSMNFKLFHCAFDLRADMGYSDGQDAAACFKEGIQRWISKPNTSLHRKKGFYVKEDCRYSQRSDYYYCPTG
jgi:hypothetical protein